MANPNFLMILRRIIIIILIFSCVGAFDRTFAGPTDLVWPVGVVGRNCQQEVAMIGDAFGHTRVVQLPSYRQNLEQLPPHLANIELFLRQPQLQGQAVTTEQLISAYSQEIFALIATSGSSERKFFLVSHLFGKIYGFLGPDRQRLMNHFSETFVRILQIMQQTEILQLITEAHLYDDTRAGIFTPGGYQFPLSRQERLDALLEVVDYWEDILERFLLERPSPPVLAEVALLLSQLYQQSPWANYRSRLPMRGLPLRMLDAAHTAKVKNATLYAQFAKHYPRIELLVGNVLEELLRSPQTHPAITLYFLQHHPSFFGSIRRYPFVALNPLQSGQYYLDPQKIFASNSGFVSEWSAWAENAPSDDFVVGLVLPESNYLRKFPIPVRSDYIKTSAGPWVFHIPKISVYDARILIWKIIARLQRPGNKKSLREFLQFRVLSPTNQNWQDLSKDQGPNFLRSLFGTKSVVAADQLRPSLPVNISPVLTNEVAGELVSFPEQLQLITEGMGTVGQNSAEIARLVSRLHEQLNAQADHLAQTVKTLYQLVLDPQDGLATIVNYRSWPWQQKAQAVRQFPFVEKMDMLNKSYERYLSLWEQRAQLHTVVAKFYPQDTSFTMFYRVTEQRMQQAKVLQIALEQIQHIFAATPGELSGAATASELVQQLASLAEIQRQLIFWAP